MTAISCPFSKPKMRNVRVEPKRAKRIQPFRFVLLDSLQCVSATRTTHFVYATCYLCLGHVCYLCLGLGPEPRPTINLFPLDQGGLACRWGVTKNVTHVLAIFDPVSAARFIFLIKTLNLV
jgi:hypothetical protein